MPDRGRRLALSGAQRPLPGVLGQGGSRGLLPGPAGCHWDDFSSEVGRILVDETVALVHELPRGTINGKSLEWETLLMFRLRDGKIAEVKVFQHTQYELDEWWNS